MHSPAQLVRDFYGLRQRNDPELLRDWLAPDVRWCEPEVGDHMGVLTGADSVIGMVGRALAATGGTFRLEVASTVETGTHCAATIHWTAVKNGQPLRGQEMAVYGFRGGKIYEAYFYAANLADDEVFWGD
jgi:hypothetical protein